ncbi:MAG: hypothetical protein CVU40_14625, partial [Chloroflexi bacterium HGW-Chloroflexi-2]
GKAIFGAWHLEGIRMHQSPKTRPVNPKTKSALHLVCLTQPLSPGATHFWRIVHRIGFAKWCRFSIPKCIAPEYESTVRLV